jgi:hypothetical protein
VLLLNLCACFNWTVFVAVYYLNQANAIPDADGFVVDSIMSTVAKILQACLQYAAHLEELRYREQIEDPQALIFFPLVSRIATPLDNIASLTSPGSKYKEKGSRSFDASMDSPSAGSPQRVKVVPRQPTTPTPFSGVMTEGTNNGSGMPDVRQSPFKRGRSSPMQAPLEEDELESSLRMRLGLADGASRHVINLHS